MDVPGHDEVLQDGTHRVEHRQKQLNSGTAVATQGSTSVGRAVQPEPKRPMKEVQYEYRTAGKEQEQQENTSQPYKNTSVYGTTADEWKSDPEHTSLREKLKPYGHRLKEDIKNAPMNTIRGAKETAKTKVKEAVQYADQRTDDAMSNFDFFGGPAKQVQECRNIRRRAENKRLQIQEERSTGAREVPVAKRPTRRERMGTGFLFSEGFAPTPIIFPSIHGSRATGRKRKRDGIGPEDLLL
jgi:hypothetical protein